MCFYQAEWREEVKQHFEKIKSEGTCLHRLDEELINRRREELRFVLYIHSFMVSLLLQQVFTLYQISCNQYMVVLLLAYMYETTFTLSHFYMSLVCPPLVHENKCLECMSIVEDSDSLMRMHNDISSLFSSQACFGHP